MRCQLRRFTVLAGMLGTIKGPWLVVGDFDMTPQTVKQPQRYSFVGGELVLPENGPLTCTAGKSGRFICDFGVASKEMRQRISRVEVDTSKRTWRKPGSEETSCQEHPP